MEFEAEIDLSKIPHISKFSYMKKLLAPSVTALVDGLPFTTEGYERAKNILKQRYGKTRVIVNAHVSNIISLPFIISLIVPTLIRSMSFLKSFCKA